MAECFLEIRNLKKYFNTTNGKLHAVDDISFTVEKGKTIGIVGESGCGKSTLGRVVTRLTDATDGEMLLNGKYFTNFKGRELVKLRKKIQMIFQDPYSSLDPRKTVYNIIAEPLIIHKVCINNDSLESKVLELMKLVGIAERFVNAFPHELDGGGRQRIGIARALALSPEIIICDEPVSALDVSIQAQILNLLKRLQQEYGYTYIFITHDLSVVKHFCHEVLVMYLGQMVEKAPVNELFFNPKHPYTKALISAIPRPILNNKEKRILLKGEISSPIEPGDECRFADRCNCACDECHKCSPTIIDVGNGHYVNCNMLFQNN